MFVALLATIALINNYTDIESDQDVIIEDSSDGEEYLDTCSTNSPSAKNIISIVIAFLLKLRVVYNVSDRAVVLLLCFFKFILMMVGNAFGVSELKEAIYFPQSLHGCYSYLCNSIHRIHCVSILPFTV